MKKLVAMLLPALLVACPQTPEPLKSPVLEKPLTPTLLGSLTVAFGIDGKGASAQFKPNTLQNQTLTPITESTLLFNNQQFQALDIPSSSERFLQARFDVTNNSNVARQNLTLVAYRKAGNSGGSAFANVQTFGGGAVDVNTLKPTHAMTTVSCTTTAVCVDNANADLQIFTRSEINTLTAASNGTLINASPTTGEGILHYGFVARKGSSGTYRTIPGNTCTGGVGCNKGTVSIALRVPQATDAGLGSAYRYSMTFLVFTDNVARVTESLEEQGSANAATRAATLTGGASLATMCGTSQTSGTFIAGVRTVGVGVDTAWMGGNFFDNTGTNASFTGIVGNSEKVYSDANAALTARFTPLGGATLKPVNQNIASATTANGGNLGIVNAGTGTLTIRPRVNFRATDSFVYKIFDGSCTSPNYSASLAAPTTTVWYIDSSAASGGDGRSHTPFRSVSNLNLSAPNLTADGDIIYIKSSLGSTALTLKNSQQVIGSGEALVVGTETLLAAGTAPTISSPFTVATNNTIKGLTFAGLSGTVGGTLTVSNASIAAGTSQAINLTNGTLAVTLKSVSSSGGTYGIQLTNTTGSLSVTGTGSTAESGGVLTGHTDGVNLATQFGTVFLKNMRISSSVNEGIDATPSTGTNLLRLEDTTISGIGTAPTFHDAVSYIASGTSVNTLEMIGTTTITAANVDTVASRIVNGDANGIFVRTTQGSSASMTLRVEKTGFLETESRAINLQYQSSGVTVSTIDDNRIELRTIDGSGVRVDTDTPTQTHKLRVQNNFIDLHAGANTGASNGIEVVARAGAVLQALIQGNTVLDAESIGIRVFAGTSNTATTTNVQLSLIGNTTTSSDPLAIVGINVQSGVSGAGSSGVTTCLNAMGNNSNFSDAAANNYELRRVTNNTFNLHGATGTPYTTAVSVQNWLTGAPRNNLQVSKISVLGSAAPGYGTCTVFVPSF